MNKSDKHNNLEDFEWTLSESELSGRIPDDKKAFPQDRQRLTKIFVVVFILLIIPAVFFTPSGVNAPHTRSRAEATRCASQIILPINQYAEQHGSFPESIEPVLDSNLLPDGLPDNPFLGGNVKMKSIKFMNPDSNGNFTYVPITENGKVDQFFLLLYSKYGDMDVNLDGTNDYVILVYYESRGKPESLLIRNVLEAFGKIEDLASILNSK